MKLLNRKQKETPDHRFALQDVATYQRPYSRVSDLYKKIIDHIKKEERRLSGDRYAGRVYTMVSMAPLYEKSLTLVNTAIALAQQGYRVLMVDSDLHSPKLHSTFKKNNDAGFSELLQQQLHPDQVIENTGIENLFLLPSGVLPYTPSIILGSAKTAYFLDRIREHYDYVLVDLPPLNTLQESFSMLPLMDGVILILEEGAGDRNDLLELRRDLSLKGVHLLGTVVISPELQDVDHRSRRSSLSKNL